MSYSVKTSDMAVCVAELQNIANEDVEAGKKTKGFPCAKVISSLEKPETMRCGIEMLNTTTLCEDCYALYKAVEVGDLKKPLANESASVWQRMANYVRQHSKLAVGVGIGAGLTLIGTGLHGILSRPAETTMLSTSSPVAQNTSPTAAWNTASTLALHTTSAQEPTEIKCKNGQVFLLDIEGYRLGYSTDFVQIAKTKGLEYEYPINLLRINNEDVNQTDQRCHFSLDNVYPSRGTQIKFMNSGVMDISSRLVISREGQGAIVARSANDKHLSISMNDNCDIPTEYKEKCHGYYPSDETIQWGTGQGYFKSVPKATTASTTASTTTPAANTTPISTLDLNTTLTSPSTLNTTSTSSSKVAVNSKCKNGQLFLVDIEGDRGENPMDTIKIIQNIDSTTAAIRNLLRVKYDTATQANQSCHFLLEDFYPANGTQITFANHATLTTSSKPLLFTQGQGAIVAKSTNSTEHLVSFTENCNIPAEYQNNCTGFFLQDEFIRDGIEKGMFNKA